MTRAAVILLAAALLASPWRGHIDDTDAQLYQVLARNMAASHRWFEPGPAPSSSSPFREHLPFGLWPYVAALRIAGEGALPWAGAVFSLLTIAALLVLVPRTEGVAAALVLACTETFFLYGGRPRLDPPLIFFSTVSALLALRPRPKWLLAALAAAAAASIKGPFGLAPLACAALARAIVDRSVRVLLSGVVAVVLAAMPVVVFLLLADVSWRDGYARAQLLASATGARTDGTSAWWGAVVSIAGRFWPGLPFALLAATQRRNRTLALLCALLVVVLSLPARKVWNHELVAYPLLALLAGEWLAPYLDRWPKVVPALAAAAIAFAGLGLGARLLQPPCVASRELASRMPPPGTPILLVSAPTDWRTLVGLAAEQRLEPIRAAALEEGAGARFALVQERLFREGTWQPQARARGWVLATR